MTRTDEVPGDDLRRPPMVTDALAGFGGRALLWLSMLVVFVVATLVTGVGVVALLARRASADTWSRWSDVGETFGAMNSVFSGLALAALVVTFGLQSRELRTQRNELVMQRVALARSQEELHKTAEASVRTLHMNLLKMGIDDPDLAEVWPPLEIDIPHQRNRQYLYANLIFQHARVAHRIGHYSEAEIEGDLRYLFTSPLMRDYWRAAAYSRSFLLPGTAEFRFCQVADAICQEYEFLLANGQRMAPRSETRTRDWPGLDSDQSTRAS